MARYHIVCSTLSSSACAPGGYTHVTHVGYETTSGGTSVVTRETMVQWINEGSTAYTSGGGETAEVKVFNCDKCPREFLKTVPDDTKANNLHNLPNC